MKMENIGKFLGKEEGLTSPFGNASPSLRRLLGNESVTLEHKVVTLSNLIPLALSEREVIRVIFQCNGHVPVFRVVLSGADDRLTNTHESGVSGTVTLLSDSTLMDAVVVSDENEHDYTHKADNNRADDVKNSKVFHVAAEVRHFLSP